MTVAELIERLQQLPGALDAYAVDGDYGPYEITSAEIENYHGPRSVVIR